MRERYEMGKGKNKGTLRCGLCWRNLATVYGQALHMIFGDGSMRCYAPEGRSTAGGGQVRYTSTRVVLDCASRDDRIHEVVNHG